VNEPLRPTYIGDTDFTNPDPEAAESGFTVPPEGNGHQAEFTKDDAYVIGADEDFAPYALLARNVDDGTDITASQGSGTTKLEQGETITGESKFAGRACDTDPAVPEGDGSQIAVVERGVCDFTVKVANVIDAGGYAAVLIFNRPRGVRRVQGDAGHERRGRHPDVRRRAARSGLRHLSTRRASTTTRPAAPATGRRSRRSRSARRVTSSPSRRTSTGGATCTCSRTRPAGWPSSTRTR